MKKLTVFLVLGTFCLVHRPGLAQVSGFDQVGTTAFQFLKVIPNARAAAMGDATAATMHSSEAAFFNPAGLVHAPAFDVSLSYLDWFLDVNITSLSLSRRLNGLGTFAVHALVTNLGEIEETRVDQLLRDETTGIYNPGLTGRTVSAGAFTIGVSFARALTDKFSFGVTAKLAREDLIAETATAVVFDGGLAYRTGFRSLLLGVALQNFGAEVKYLDESYPLPQTLKIGVAGDLVGPDGAFVLSSPSHRVQVAYDLSQTRDHSQQQHVGFEYSFSDFFTLRGGYKINFDEESWTVGGGLKLSRFRVDYAYNDFGAFLDSVQRFTINFEID